MNSEICSNLDAEIGNLLWFWVIFFFICRICIKYLTNIMPEVGLLHLSGGPTRSLNVDSWVLGPNCELHIIHLSYTDLWTISFSVLQRLDWSSIEIFHKAAQLLFFQPGQWFPFPWFDVELNMPQCQFQYFQMPDFAEISALNFAMFPHSTVNLQNRLQWRNNLGITIYLFNLNFFATVGIKLLLFCMTIMAKSTNGVVNG